MDTEREHRDLIRLNAFVDGEAGPDERADIAARIASDRAFARSHAVLVRLKAGIADYAADESSSEIPAMLAPPRRFPRWAALGAGIAAAILVTAGLYIGTRDFRGPALAVDRTAIERLIVQVALPSAPVVPELAAGGMTLSGVEVRDTADRPMLVATYAGPRGCRLELRIRDGAAASATSDGTSRYGWTVGRLSYQLVAFGMPDIRFAIIAGAAERQSRLAADPTGDVRLQQARAAAPPCVG